MYKLSEFYEIPCEHLLRLRDDLFKPNLKLVRAIAIALGISLKAAMALMIAIYVGAIIFAFGLFAYAGNNFADRSQEVREVRDKIVELDLKK